MSMIGTGIAASVAQTSHNAQQIARQQEKRRSDQSRGARDAIDRYEHLIQDVEEGEATRLAIDEQVPDHEQKHTGDEADDGETRDQSDSPTTPGELPGAGVAELGEQTDAVALRQKLLDQHPAALYRHLDLEA